MSDTLADLVRHFERIYVDHMRDLPVVNPRIKVEAVGFRNFEGNELGVLITPWFMNLVLLPAGDAWCDSGQGDTLEIDFPSGPIEFTLSRDERLGIYLTAALFRTTSEFADHSMARETAEQVMTRLFVPARDENSLSRRELLTGMWGR